MERSLRFYTKVLGFKEIARPEFDCDGAWLWGFGVRYVMLHYFFIMFDVCETNSIHLIKTTCEETRQQILAKRIEHFSHQLPQVDHIAFVANNLLFIQDILDKEGIFYKQCNPVAGLVQLFFFDPDGNVLEVSNCAPDIGQVKCLMTTADEKLTPTSPICNSASKVKDDFFGDSKSSL